jgi:hypothetical protein
MSDERSSPAPAAVDAATRPENRGEARNEQATQLDAWEDEGGTPRVTPPAGSEPAQGGHIDDEAAG